mgnify:CR=1 FL=1
MTIDQYAERTQRSARTVRRWIKSGLLPARRVPLGPDFSAFRYDIADDHIRLAGDIHERQMRKLSGMSPGLGLYLSRKLGKTDRSSAMRSGTDLDDVQESHLVRCPRCGHSFTTGLR